MNSEYAYRLMINAENQYLASRNEADYRRYLMAQERFQTLKTAEKLALVGR
jgi:hypothetical protein